MPETDEVETMVLDPHFNYHREVEILKRFLEQLTRLSGDEHLGSELVAYVRTNIQHVRPAMGSVLADDVERQIRIDKDFPIPHPAIQFHAFEPYELNPPYCAECGERRELIFHTL